VRRIADLLRRLPARNARDLTGSETRRPGSGADGRSGQQAERDRLQQLAREIDQVASYVGRLKREIGALKVGEAYSKRLPGTVNDLKGVHAATKGAVESIMAAAEGILERDASEPGYSAFVSERALAIVQACSFEDLAGQRLDRAMDGLLDLERRLERFAKAVKIADAPEFFDRTAIMRDARREVLLVEGPQDGGAAIEQTEVDKLFR
jgi:chemotaxis protein CheZ